MPFLSLLDDRAKPKGSRDPLGFELVWTHFGRQVIGNLTTITSSLNNFAVALLGFHWANEIHAHLPEHEQQAQIRDTFLCYEQMAGYLRFIAGDEEMMGITRVRKRMEETQPRISFGLGTDAQILSDQASYGLWGLYSAAMRDTGLIKGDKRIPKDLGIKIAKLIENKINKSELINIFTKRNVVTRANLEPLAKSFRYAISNKKIQSLLLDALMQGNESKKLQHEMWRVTQTIAESGASLSSLPAFINQVKKTTQQTDLKNRLIEIERVERILVAANNIFHYCRRKDGEPVEKLLSALSNKYSYTHLSRDILKSEFPRKALIADILNALLDNNTGDALTHILELNRVVMTERGGAPWVEIEQGNVLRVRVQSETSELKDQESLETKWDYDYFIGSYIQLACRGLGVTWTTK